MSDRITFRIPGVWAQEIEGFEDERGIFSPLVVKDIGFDVKESYISKSNVGVLRGLHFQKPPFPQNKLVYCLDGMIEDIIVDLRKNSSTYGKNITFFMDSIIPYRLHVPAGCAHGYYAWKDSTVLYFMDEYFHEECYGGIHWQSSERIIPSNLKVSLKDSRLPYSWDYETPFE